MTIPMQEATVNHTNDPPTTPTDPTESIPTASDGPDCPAYEQGLLFHRPDEPAGNDCAVPHLKVILPDEPDPAPLVLVGDDEAEMALPVAVDQHQTPEDDCLTAARSDEPAACGVAEMPQAPIAGDLDAAVPEPAVAPAVRRAPVSFLEWESQESVQLSEPEADAPTVRVAAAHAPDPPCDPQPSKRLSLAPVRIGAGRLFRRVADTAIRLRRTTAARVRPASRAFQWNAMWRVAGLTTACGLALYVMLRTVLG